MSFDMDNCSAWDALPIGSFVTLSDEQGLEESMKAGSGIKGLDYIVKQVQTVTEQSDACTWIILYLEKGDDTCVRLVVKCVDDTIAFGVYFEDDEVVPTGDREHLLSHDLYALFSEPEGEWRPCDLDYAQSFDWEDEAAGPFSYTQKPQGTLFGESKQRPHPKGTEPTAFASITEYCTTTSVENPEILILETGGLDKHGDPSESGGIVQFWFGCPITRADIDIVPA